MVNFYTKSKIKFTTGSLYQQGFTLIELLLVVLIIGILSGVVLSVLNVNGLRQKSRDSQRVSDLKKIQTALELYFVDHRQYYFSTSIPTWQAARNNLTPALTPTYIKSIPVDPIFPGGNPEPSVPCSPASAGNYYSYKSDGKYYYLTARMEVPSSDDASLCSSLSNFSTNFGCTIPADVYCYGVQNP